ncbi:HoxN/HupN/NixA family nickel/cobalt transporter [Derxia lacustris]|uniref:HoxN/HupN/NixA family nickel/cobalt transporter n=1 Tax=Derxia lacustris TaxID=764842 RepID=UPI000A172021|nr:hypothetical protein [Derxia lacustris]
MDLPLSASLPLALAFGALLGARHGMDADHLAAIDGLVRLHARAGRHGLARLAGALFSLGHGAVVLAAALACIRTGGLHLPDWLDRAGSLFSIACLGLIGAFNLKAALVGDAPVSGWRGRLVQRAPVFGRAWGGLLLGMLFAISFDTLTLALWFGTVGLERGSAAAGAGLALAFTAGMCATDCASGWWISRLLRGHLAPGSGAARWVPAIVGAGALAVAGLGLARQLSVSADALVEGREFLLGLGFLLASGSALWWTRRVGSRRSAAV